MSTLFLCSFKMSRTTSSIFLQCTLFITSNSYHLILNFNDNFLSFTILVNVAIFKTKLLNLYRWSELGSKLVHIVSTSSFSLFKNLFPVLCMCVLEHFLAT
jgi:hypothetical protein